jgi:hypothetical protein
VGRSTCNTPYVGISLMELEDLRSRSGISLSKSEDVSSLFAKVEVWNTVRFGANALSRRFRPIIGALSAPVTIDFPCIIRIF